LDSSVDLLTLVFSFYGQYVLPSGEQVWIGTLIRALGALGYTAEAVRTFVSRMQQKGYLQGCRVGRRSFYRLAEEGQRNVSGGSDRIFAVPADTHDGYWTVVTYSVPEKDRKQRDLLRDSLKSWGFGVLTPGTCISPRALTPEQEADLRRLDLWKYVEVFNGLHLGSSSVPELVAHAWPQLGQVAGRYRAYIDRYAPVLSRCRSGQLSQEASFANQLLSLCDFVAVNLEDPALPASLLPQDWPRPAARTLFKTLQHLLREPAACFFREIAVIQGGSDGQQDRQ
jgi:phenylacetic acid degradation operon negative regulatory protein